MILLSLDEIDRVKRLNHITTDVALERKTGITRKTWRRAMNDRKPTSAILDALEELGARPSKILVSERQALVGAA